MKKYMLAFLITIPILLIAWYMVDSTEGQKNTYNDTVEESASNQIGILQETDAEEITIPEEAEATDEESDNELSDSDRYFLEQQEYISNISNGLCSYEKIGEDEYEITLYNKEHVKIFSGLYPLHHSWVKAITGNVLEIGVSTGSPARYTFYFDIETAEMSDVFFNAKVFGDKYIAYMDDEVIGADEITLTLTDIFERGILHQEVVRDFSVCADPMSAVYGVEMIDDNSIRLEYCKGEDYTTVSETIELEWTPMFSDEPITVLAKETLFFPDDGSVAYWHEYGYDSTGNLTKDINYNGDDGIDCWKEYEYDSTGKLVKETSYYGATDNIDACYKYEYDSAGNQTKKFYYSDDRKFVLWEKEYDSAGNVTKCIEYWYSGDIYEWIEYEYDNAGKLVKEMTHYYNGTTHWYEYEYDDAGNQTKEFYYTNGGIDDYWVEYEYDGEGRQTGGTMYYASESIWYIENEYDSTGKKTKIKITSSNDSEWKWEFEWEYDNMGNLTTYMEYREDDIYKWQEYEYITITPQKKVT